MNQTQEPKSKSAPKRDSNVSNQNIQFIATPTMSSNTSDISRDMGEGEDEDEETDPNSKIFVEKFLLPTKYVDPNKNIKQLES